MFFAVICLFALRDLLLTGVAFCSLVFPIGCSSVCFLFLCSVWVGDLCFFPQICLTMASFSILSHPVMLILCLSTCVVFCYDYFSLARICFFSLTRNITRFFRFFAAFPVRKVNCMVAEWCFFIIMHIFLNFILFALVLCVLHLYIRL